MGAGARAVWQAAFVVVAVAGAVGLLALLGWVVDQWEPLTEGETGTASLRNVALIVGGPVAVGLAVWRSMTAQRQVEAAQRQAEVAQLDSAGRQFQQGAEMLGHASFLVRVNGVRSLYDLAGRHLERYGDLTAKVLSDFSVVQQATAEGNVSTGTHECRDGSTYEGPVDGVIARAFSDLLTAELEQQYPDYAGQPAALAKAS